MSKLITENVRVNSSSYIEYRHVENLRDYRNTEFDCFNKYSSMDDAEIKRVMYEIFLDNKSVGYIGFAILKKRHNLFKRTKELVLHTFMIKERGNGYGSRIVRDIVKTNQACYDGISCWVDKTNDRAVNFYDKLGKIYEPLEESDEYLVVLS